MSGNPTGVLKTGAVQFDPPLPPEKQNAIESIGVGLLNKCFVRDTTLAFLVELLARVVRSRLFFLLLQYVLCSSLWQLQNARLIRYGLKKGFGMVTRPLLAISLHLWPLPLATPRLLVATLEKL